MYTNSGNLYYIYSEYGILNLRNNSNTTRCVVVSFDPNNLLVNEYNTAKSYTKNSDIIKEK